MKDEIHDFVFTVNKRNAFSLQKDFLLSDYDTDFIYRNFWPIFELNDFEDEDFDNLVQDSIRQFERQYGTFDSGIFFREELEMLDWQLKCFIEALQSGKSRVWDTYSGVHFIRFKFPNDKRNNTLLLTNKDEIELEMFFKHLLHSIDSFCPKSQQENTKRAKIDTITTHSSNYRKFTGDEQALVYIFDLYSVGKTAPINPIDQSLSKKQIEIDGKSRNITVKPDTFYRSVKKIIKDYDLNSERDLQSISRDWYNTVKKLSIDWPRTQAYLKTKNLIRE